MNNKPINLSPNSLNLYFECPACFWLEKNKGIKRPQPFPYSLNTAVDTLLKEEFDKYRKKRELHPLLVANNIPAKLFKNQKLLNEWRDNTKGLRYYDTEFDATLFGALDDVLEFTDKKLGVLGYKSTGSDAITVYDRFQLQLDVYTYLLQKLGYKTVDKGFLAFYIVDKGNGFKDRLPFKKEIHIIDVDASYVHNIFKEAVKLLRQDKVPKHSKECPYGKYLTQSTQYL